MMSANEMHTATCSIPATCSILVGRVRIASVDRFLATLQRLARAYAVTIQAMDAELVAGEAHLRAAVEKAIRAFTQRRHLTGDLGLEILVYLAGKRQIERALALGVAAGDRRVVILLVDPAGTRDLEPVAAEVKRHVGLEEETVAALELALECDAGKREKLERFFGITGEELQAVGAGKLNLLVLERVALLDVLK
jgi:KEOPS complex subunit Cgi121